jgi:hypothetical protein
MGSVAIKREIVGFLFLSPSPSFSVPGLSIK